MMQRWAAFQCQLCGDMKPQLAGRVPLSQEGLDSFNTPHEPCVHSMILSLNTHTFGC